MDEPKTPNLKALSPLNRLKRSGALRRALALIFCFVAADILLSLMFWLAAAASVRDGSPASACAAASADRAAIVVFYSDDPVLRQERLGSAAELARACPAASVLLVGGARPHRGYFGAVEMGRELASMGLEPSRLRTGRSSYDTETNLLEMKSLAAAEGANRLALVSDALHLLRIRTVFGQPDPGTELLFFPASGDARLTRIVSRANYEAAAWLFMLAPVPLREYVFGLIGRRGGISG